MSATTIGVCICCAMHPMTGRLCVNPEYRQCATALSPPRHSAFLRRRMRLRVRGARSEPAVEPEPAESAAPASPEPERCECSPRPRPRVPRSERPPLPAFSVRSPSWEPRRDPRERDASEEEAEPPRDERPRPPREPPREPPEPERDPERPPRPRRGGRPKATGRRLRCAPQTSSPRGRGWTRQP